MLCVEQWSLKHAAPLRGNSRILSVPGASIGTNTLMSRSLLFSRFLFRMCICSRPQTANTNLQNHSNAAQRKEEVLELYLIQPCPSQQGTFGMCISFMSLVTSIQVLGLTNCYLRETNVAVLMSTTIAFGFTDWKLVPYRQKTHSFFSFQTQNFYLKLVWTLTINNMWQWFWRVLTKWIIGKLDCSRIFVIITQIRIIWYWMLQLPL